MPTDAAMRILSVDDLASMRRVVRNLLHELGYKNIVEADDGASALKILHSEKIDFVISDWNMRKMHGLDLLLAMRSDEQLTDIPLLMMTAEAEKNAILEAAKAGVRHCIVKPFTADTLKDKIMRVFN